MREKSFEQELKELGIEIIKERDYFVAVGISNNNVSKFAKEICNDFNPIHSNKKSKPIVPGDLFVVLFLLSNGLYKRTIIEFKKISYPIQKFIITKSSILNSKNESVVNFTLKDDIVADSNSIFLSGFLREFCKISGTIFAQELEPIFIKYRKMPNPQKPRMLYESTQINLDKEIINLKVDFVQIKFLEPNVIILENQATVNFQILVLQSGRTIGLITKTLFCTNLEEYTQEKYEELKKYWYG